jgi:hypothetical protein
VCQRRPDIRRAWNPCIQTHHIETGAVRQMRVSAAKWCRTIAQRPYSDGAQRGAQFIRDARQGP